MSTGWLPHREQELAGLCQKWKTGLENPANVTAFGWNQAAVTAVLGAADAFLTARAGFPEAGGDTAGAAA